MIVFHIIARLDIGGAERVAINLAKATDAEVHIIEVARRSGKTTQALLEECSKAGIIVHRAETYGNKAGIMAFPRRFANIMKSTRPDVIHTHTEVPDLSLFLYKSLHPRSLSGIRIVRTIHNTRLWTRWKFIGRFVEKWFQGIQANVSISKSVTQSYIREWGASPDTLIYNGLPIVPQVSFNGIEKGRLNILFAGRLEPYKGISVLVEIIKRFPCYVFHICGSGSMKDMLEQELASLPNAHYYDSIPFISSIMSNFDYMFMPSVFEGLAICSIEASLAGCPVIANDCPGLGETLPPDWPLKVSDNSIEQYCGLFSKLESMNREHLISLSKTYVMEHFRLEMMVDGYLAFYKGELR